MHSIRAQLGQATLHIDLDCGREGARRLNLAKLGVWTFLLRELQAAVPTGFSHCYAHTGGRFLERDVWTEIEGARLLEDDPEVEIDDADTALMLLALLAAHGGQVHATYRSEGSAFWAFHDLSHVRRDAWLEALRGGLTPVDAAGEDRAHVEGAQEALQTGAAPLAEILRALAASEAAFLQRFRKPSQAIELLLARLLPTA